MVARGSASGGRVPALRLARQRFCPLDSALQLVHAWACLVHHMQVQHAANQACHLTAAEQDPRPLGCAQQQGQRPDHLSLVHDLGYGQPGRPAYAPLLV